MQGRHFLARVWLALPGALQRHVLDVLAVAELRSKPPIRFNRMAREGDGFLGRLAVLVTAGTTVVVLATVVALAFPGIANWLRPARTAPTYVVGDSIDLPSAAYDGAPTTLLVFVRSSCPGCQHATPIFEQVREAIVENPTVAFRLVAHAGDSAGATEYARAIGLPDSGLFMADFRSLRLQTVPTVVLVDRGGRIRGAYEGVPTDDSSIFNLLPPGSYLAK